MPVFHNTFLYNVSVDGFFVDIIRVVAQVLDYYFGRVFNFKAQNFFNARPLTLLPYLS